MNVANYILYVKKLYIILLNNVSASAKKHHLAHFVVSTSLYYSKRHFVLTFSILA